MILKKTVLEKNSIKSKKKKITSLKEEIDTLKDDLRSDDRIIILKSDVDKSYNSVIREEKKIGRDQERIEELQETLSLKIDKLDKLNTFLENSSLISFLTKCP